MTFDKTLSWKTHILKLIDKCNRNLNIIRCTKGRSWGTDKKCLLNIYKGLIQSKINYGCIVYQTASDTLLNKLQRIQNRALRVITSCPRYTPVTPLHVETATLPLDLQRDIYALKYWARSYRLGKTLPINSLVDVDPIFIYKAKPNQKLPYSQSIQVLLQKYQLSDLPIQEPSYNHNPNLSLPAIDISLCEKINKQGDPQSNLSITNRHLIHNYENFTKIFTDGSKDTKSNIAGAGIVVFNKQNEIQDQVTLKFNNSVSIFTCELYAIDRACAYAHNTNKTQTVICTDSLSSIQSIQSGHSKNRPELVNNILQTCTNIKNKGNTITLTWVPSHIGLTGNEKADTLAKLGSLDGTQIDIKLSLPEAYSVIKHIIKKQFHKRWDEYSAKHTIRSNTHPPTRMEKYHPDKQLDDIYTRLKLNGSFLNRRRIVSLGQLCSGCNVPEDDEHVLMHCIWFKHERENMQDALTKININAVNLKTLLDPPPESARQVREILFNYIKNTNLINKL